MNKILWLLEAILIGGAVAVFVFVGGEQGYIAAALYAGVAFGTLGGYRMGQVSRELEIEDYRGKAFSAAAVKNVLVAAVAKRAAITQEDIEEAVDKAHKEVDA
jgi:hypothetical protein